MMQVDDGSSGQGAQCTNDKKRITSPRCVMTFDLSSPPPSARLSPVMVQEQYNQAITRKVKILLLQGNFKEALQIGNEYLQQQIRDGWTGPLSYFQTTFQLSAPLILPSEVMPTSLSSSSPSTGTTTSYTFQVRLGTQLTAVDEITTIVLQCWYELAKKDSQNNNKNSRTKAWRHLLPLLDMYSRHPMPLQFLVEFWIPFWHSFPWKDSSDTNHLVLQQCALTWSCQVALFLMEHSNRIDEMPVLIEELRDQLILFLVTQQLAKVSSPNLAAQLLQMVLLQQSVPTSEDWKHFMMRSSEIKDPVGGTTTTISIGTHDNPRSLYALRQALGEVPDLAAITTTSTSKITDCSISKELRDKILQHDKFRNLPLSDWMTQPSLSMIPQPLFSYKWMRSLLVKWQSIVHRFPVEVQSRFWNQWCHNNTRTILSSSSVGPSETTTTAHTTTSANHPHDPQRNLLLLQQYKGRLAMSIVSVLLAWRYKGFFKKWGRACAMALLAPFTELVDALVSPTQHKIEQINR